MFCECKELSEVVFEEGSRLEKIGRGCFGGTGIRRIVIPKGVTEIQECTFSTCEELNEVMLEEGSKLKVIGEGAFMYCSNIRSI